MERAPLINAMLAKIPGRSPDSTCKSGVCKLDDAPRGVAKPGTEHGEATKSETPVQIQK